MESPGRKVRLKRWIFGSGLEGQFASSFSTAFFFFLKTNDLGTEDSITGTA